MTGLCADTVEQHSPQTSSLRVRVDCKQLDVPRLLSCTVSGSERCFIELFVCGYVLGGNRRDQHFSIAMWAEMHIRDTNTTR